MPENNSAIVVASAARTPFGKFGGSLREADYYELSATIMKEVAQRARVGDSNAIEEIYWGVGDTSACKDVFTPCVARQALLRAGLGVETNSLSFDKACISAMSAAQLVWRAIRAGDIQCGMAGGVTIQSQIPLLLRNSRWKGSGLGATMLEDPMAGGGYAEGTKLSVLAGQSAVQNGIGREEQDEWAMGSHQKYGRAYDKGYFGDEVLPIEYRLDGKVQGTLRQDEQFRADTTLERLSKLKTIFGSPTVTPGNAPGLNDGAAALVLMSNGKARELGIEPLGEIVAMLSVGMGQDYLAETPATAIDRVLKRAGLTLDQMAVIEINEAFAAVPLVSAKLLANGDEAAYRDIKSRLNVNGGAVAIGHPNTATGARLLATTIYELRRRGGGFGIAAICGALGQGDAAIVKVG